jgi:hypothetical protein
MHRHSGSTATASPAWPAGWPGCQVCAVAGQPAGGLPLPLPVAVAVPPLALALADSGSVTGTQWHSGTVATGSPGHWQPTGTLCQQWHTASGTEWQGPAHCAPVCLASWPAHWPTGAALVGRKIAAVSERRRKGDARACFSWQFPSPSFSAPAPGGGCGAGPYGATATWLIRLALLHCCRCGTSQCGSSRQSARSTLKDSPVVLHFSK